MLGFINPVPMTIRAMEAYRDGIPNGRERAMCPNMIRTPPKKTVRRDTQIRSEIQPPIAPDMYTKEP